MSDEKRLEKFGGIEIEHIDGDETTGGSEGLTASYVRQIDIHERGDKCGHCVRMYDADDVDRLVARMASQLQSFIDGTAEVTRLTRELDVAVYGESGAAKQAGLCDLVASIPRLMAGLREFEAAVWSALREAGYLGDDAARGVKGLRDLFDAKRSKIEKLEAENAQLREECKHWSGMYGERSDEAQQLREQMAIISRSAHESHQLYADTFSDNEQLREQLAKSERDHDHDLKERDDYHEFADRLADAIAKITGEEIGEHTSGNCPWSAALDAAEGYDDELRQLRPRLARAEALTDAQCDEIVKALETYEWTGFSRDDIRLIAGTINTYRQPAPAGAAVWTNEMVAEVEKGVEELRKRMVDGQSEPQLDHCRVEIASPCGPTQWEN
jgi:hypothetical protein